MSERFQLVQRLDFIKNACRDKRVLHLGCTDYPYTEHAIEHEMLLHFELEKIAADLYGFDSDQAGLDILEKASSKNLYLANLENLDEMTLTDTFDVIIGGEMIEHISNPGLFLKGIRRFMREDTQLILTTVNAYCAMRFLIYALRGKGGRNEPVHPDHVAYYSFRTLSLMLERHGLQLKEFCFYDLGEEHRPFNRWFYNIFNDISVRLFPQLSDGVIAVATLGE